MIKKISVLLVLFIILLHPISIHTENNKKIEIFDPQQNKVVKTVEFNEEINNMILGWVDKIDSLYPSINPITDTGYTIRFPLDSAIQVQNQWLDTSVEEIYLTIPEKDKPCLIIFDKKNSPSFFLFPGQIDKLSKVLNFQLK